jgi:L-fuconolactonase
VIVDCFRKEFTMLLFPIIDTHVHLWNPAQIRLSWLDDLNSINAAFGLEEYRTHTQGINVAGIVYVEVGVEPQYAFLEARQVAALAEHEPLIRGIVAAAPLEFGARAHFYLEALAALGARVKGVRRLLQGESDPDYCLRPDFIAGVKLLPQFAFSFDICILHHQLAGVVELVRRCPEVNFILDHIAKPGIKAGLLDPWRAQIRELAALPNVVCKISGVTTEADHAAWTPEQLAPYILHVLEAFGPDRVMFGGDWPVALLATSYARWVETLAALTADLPEPDRRKLWHDNAARVYRLEN